MIRVLQDEEVGRADEARLIQSIFKDGGSLMKVLDFEHRAEPVSYTHLTLPTILLV